jgi:hypothetical protein
MPVYLTRHDIDDPAQGLEAPAVPDAVNRGTGSRAHLAWPASAAAATAELKQLAQALTAADATVSRDGQDVVLPALDSGPGDTAGMRVRGTGRASHALNVITAAELVPLIHAAGRSPPPATGRSRRPRLRRMRREARRAVHAELPAGPLNHQNRPLRAGRRNRRPAP